MNGARHSLNTYSALRPPGTAAATRTQDRRIMSSRAAESKSPAYPARTPWRLLSPQMQDGRVFPWPCPESYRSPRSAPLSGWTPKFPQSLISADACAFSSTSRMTQCDAGTGCGCSGQPCPPMSRRTKPQPAASAVTFPGMVARRGPARWTIPGRRRRLSRNSCPGSGLDPNAGHRGLRHRGSPGRCPRPSPLAA